MWMHNGLNSKSINTRRSASCTGGESLFIDTKLFKKLTLIHNTQHFILTSKVPRVSFPHPFVMYYIQLACVKPTINVH
jgi:hypothetical protein